MKAGEKMSSKTYLWIEDRKDKASYIFWETLMHEICPNVIVESKTNNRELVKAVKSLSDKENRYIIAFDNSFDNVQIYMEQKILRQTAALKNNVFLLKLICFEYVLLEFDKLIDWIYTIDDEFINKRASAIAARQKLVEILKSGQANYKAIQEVMDYDKHLNDHNIEQISAKLLFDLTRNTGFEVSKGTIGDCWVKSCCDWAGRQVDDIFGLDNERLSVTDKMKSIYCRTSLCREFSSIGLEVSL
ncbi:MAG: hypothetical protein PHE02_05345 [Lachnospiraceae bacterium]|nr:hypothetical protein [Lachnospiraceae bacterium]